MSTFIKNHGIHYPGNMLTLDESTSQLDAPTTSAAQRLTDRGSNHASILQTYVAMGHAVEFVAECIAEPDRAQAIERLDEYRSLYEQQAKRKLREIYNEGQRPGTGYRAMTEAMRKA